MIREEHDWEAVHYVRHGPRGLPRRLVPAPRIAEPSEAMCELRRALERRGERRRAEGEAIGRFLAEPTEPPLSDAEWHAFVAALVHQHGRAAVETLLRRTDPHFKLPDEKKEP